MTPKERVCRALAHGKTDLVPYTIYLSKETRKDLVRYYGDARFEAWIANHIEATGPGDWGILPREELRGGCFRDVWGCVWKSGHAMHLVDSPLKGPSLEGYRFPDFTCPELYRHVPEFLDRYGDRFTRFTFWQFFFERAWALRGFENFLMDLLLHPDFVDELLESLMAIHLQVIDYVAGKHRFDAIGFSDDYGQQHGLLMSPAHWRRFIKGRLRRMCEHCHALGLRVLLHSCGDVSPIIGDLVEVGVDILNPFQPESMDLLAIKRQFGQWLAFEGGISTQKTVPFGTVEEIRREIRYCLEAFGAGGGYIASHCKPVFSETSAANAAALIEGLVFQDR